MLQAKIYCMQVQSCGRSDRRGWLGACSSCNGRFVTFATCGQESPHVASVCFTLNGKIHVYRIPHLAIIWTTHAITTRTIMTCIGILSLPLASPVKRHLFLLPFVLGANMAAFDCSFLGVTTISLPLRLSNERLLCLSRDRLCNRLRQ